MTDVRTTRGRRRDWWRARRLVAMAAVGIAGCAETPAPAPATREPLAVTVVTVASREMVVPHESVGTLRAAATAVVAAKVLSQIERVHVDAGEVVDRGQLLVELDDRELAAAVRQADAARDELTDALAAAGRALDLARTDLELARATHERYAQLREARSVSDQEYDEVSARLTRARVAVELAEAQERQIRSRQAQVDAQRDAARIAAGYARITAPMDGTVIARHVDPGSLATPGAPLLTIEGVGQLELTVAVPAALLSGVAAGASVPVEVEGAGPAGEPALVTGRVGEIVRAVDPASRTSTVTLELPDDARLRSGLFGHARLPGRRRVTLTVPADAVVERGQIQTVFVVEEGVARQRLVSIGGDLAGEREVLSGLAAGERVARGPAGLSDGQPVTEDGR